MSEYVFGSVEEIRSSGPGSKQSLDPRHIDRRIEVIPPPKPLDIKRRGAWAPPAKGQSLFAMRQEQDKLYTEKAVQAAKKEAVDSIHQAAQAQIANSPLANAARAAESALQAAQSRMAAKVSAPIEVPAAITSKLMATQEKADSAIHLATNALEVNRYVAAQASQAAQIAKNAVATADVTAKRAEIAADVRGKAEQIAVKLHQIAAEQTAKANQAAQIAQQRAAEAGRAKDELIRVTQAAQAAQQQAAAIVQKHVGMMSQIVNPAQAAKAAQAAQQAAQAAQQNAKAAAEAMQSRKRAADATAAQAAQAAQSAARLIASAQAAQMQAAQAAQQHQQSVMAHEMAVQQHRQATMMREAASQQHKQNHVAFEQATKNAAIAKKAAEKNVAAAQKAAAEKIAIEQKAIAERKAAAAKAAAEVKAAAEKAATIKAAAVNDAANVMAAAENKAKAVLITNAPRPPTLPSLSTPPPPSLPSERAPRIGQYYDEEEEFYVDGYETYSIGQAGSTSATGSRQFSPAQAGSAKAVSADPTADRILNTPNPIAAMDEVLANVLRRAPGSDAVFAEINNLPIDPPYYKRNTGREFKRDLRERPFSVFINLFTPIENLVLDSVRNALEIGNIKELVIDDLVNRSKMPVKLDLDVPDGIKDPIAKQLVRRLKMIQCFVILMITRPDLLAAGMAKAVYTEFTRLPNNAEGMRQKADMMGNISDIFKQVSAKGLTFDGFNTSNLNPNFVKFITGFFDNIKKTMPNLPFIEDMARTVSESAEVVRFFGDYLVFLVGKIGLRYPDPRIVIGDYAIAAIRIEKDGGSDSNVQNDINAVRRVLNQLRVKGEAQKWQGNVYTQALNLVTSTLSRDLDTISAGVANIAKAYRSGSRLTTVGMPNLPRIGLYDQYAIGQLWKPSLPPPPSLPPAPSAPPPPSAPPMPSAPPAPRVITLPSAPPTPSAPPAPRVITLPSAPPTPPVPPGAPPIPGNIPNALAPNLLAVAQMNGPPSSVLNLNSDSSKNFLKIFRALGGKGVEVANQAIQTANGFISKLPGIPREIADRIKLPELKNVPGLNGYGIIQGMTDEFDLAGIINSGNSQLPLNGRMFVIGAAPAAGAGAGGGAGGGVGGGGGSAAVGKFISPDMVKMIVKIITSLVPQAGGIVTGLAGGGISPSEALTNARRALEQAKKAATEAAAAKDATAAALNKNNSKDAKIAAIDAHNKSVQAEKAAKEAEEAQAKMGAAIAGEQKAAQTAAMANMGIDLGIKAAVAAGEAAASTAGYSMSGYSVDGYEDNEAVNEQENLGQYDGSETYSSRDQRLGDVVSDERESYNKRKARDADRIKHPVDRFTPAQLQPVTLPVVSQYPYPVSQFDTRFYGLGQVDLQAQADEIAANARKAAEAAKSDATTAAQAAGILDKIQQYGMEVINDVSSFLSSAASAAKGNAGVIVAGLGALGLVAFLAMNKQKT